MSSEILIMLLFFGACTITGLFGLNMITGSIAFVSFLAVRIIFELL